MLSTYCDLSEILLSPGPGSEDQAECESCCHAGTGVREGAGLLGLPLYCPALCRVRPSRNMISTEVESLTCGTSDSLSLHIIR